VKKTYLLALLTSLGYWGLRSPPPRNGCRGPHELVQNILTAANSLKQVAIR